jgi:glycosyltransferase involved in cell wall biosynthesis
MTAKISILTPSYNYSRFLADAVDSVRAQGVQGTEHVIADGASNDGTVDYLEAQPDLTWFSEPDRGQSDALNRAFARSTAPFVGWLNADEYYLPGALDAVLRRFDAQPSADVVYGDAAFVDEQGRLLRLLPQHPFSALVLRYYGCFIPSCAVFFRRSVLPLEPWDADARTVMDWDLYLQLAGAGATFAYVPRPLGAFRVHRAQVTATPLAAEDPEKVRIRTRHGIRQGPPARYALRPLGKAVHGALKLAAGSYRRQRSAKLHRSQPTAWWTDRTEGSASSSLIEL